MARILGIDISNSAARGTLLRTGFKRVELEGYFEVPIAAATEEEGQVEAQREAVATLLAAIGRPPDRIVASLDGRHASLRVVSLPAGAAKRAAEVLPFELETLLPFAPEDAVIDHQPIDMVDGEVRLLAAAVPSEKVRERLDALQAIGIDPRELAVGAAALDGLAELIPSLSTGESLLIVEVGTTETNLCMLRNGRCEMARTLSRGVSHAASGQLEAELNRTMISHRASGGPEPSRILLAGEVATDENAAAWLAERLHAEVSQVPLPPGPGAGEGGIGRFARSAALAARMASRSKRIDLRQGEFAPSQTGGIIAKHARLLGVCAAIVLSSFMFSTWARWQVLDDERTALSTELERVTEESFGEGTTSASEAEQLLLSGPRTRDPLPRFDAYDVLDLVSQSVPIEIVHNTRRLHIELDDDGHGGRFELQGRVASVAERDSIAEVLESHECVHDLEKGRTSPGPGNEGLNYQIEATLRCPGAPAPEERGRRRRRRRDG